MSEKYGNTPSFSISQWSLSAMTFDRVSAFLLNSPPSPKFSTACSVFP
jgi:hypothetical protein